MKAKTKSSIGIVLIMCAGLLGYTCAWIFHFNFSLAILLSTILAFIGLCLIAAGTNELVEFAPERRYKLINYSARDHVRYTTFEYQDVYGITRIHTFKNINWETYDSQSGTFTVGYEPTVGRVYTACKETWSKDIVLKHRQE